MTLRLELPPDVEALLTKEAEKEGLTLPEYALRKLMESPEVLQKETAADSILRLTEEIFEALPDEEKRKLPPDYAINYKHYLHGYPKVGP